MITDIDAEDILEVDYHQNTKEKLKIKVCDVVMGGGKTESCITHMNEDVGSNYIFITPYLKEVDRIKECCKSRNFVSPTNKGQGKLDNLKYLLSKKHNIASTHALFQAYDAETLSLIRDGNYKLIMDEVFDVVEPIALSEDDIQGMFNNKQIILIEGRNDGAIKWIKESYSGRFDDIKGLAENGDIFYYNGQLMIWKFPIEVFEAFQDTIILTYMFKAQIQKYYYDMNGVEIEYIGAEKRSDGTYHFCFNSNFKQPEYTKELINKIHICDDDKLNSIGEKETVFSVTWYEKAAEKRNKPALKVLQNNMANYFRHKCSVKADKCIWTTYKDFQKYLSKNYTKSFVSFNTRATNEYGSKTHLAYLVNVYLNPYLKNYFSENGVDVLEDTLALSSMIQWIWRSAIRNNKDIWIYVPSSRMRELLKEWLQSLTI